jgi:phage repressor protein C with HTH and peptisase S24 domain
LKELKVSQAELGRRVGVSQPTINAILSGDTQRSKHLREIAIALSTTEAWLLGETEDPLAGAISELEQEDMADRLGVTLIPEMDMGFAMVAGTFVEVFERTGFRAFDREWARSISRGNLEKLFVARGDGDSMEPTLHDGDIVLIDCAESTIDRGERVWAVVYGGLGLIKRVRRLPGDRYHLLSDNQRVPPIETSAEDLHVVGRVIWIGRRI